MKLVLATQNRHKLSEAQAILRAVDAGIELLLPADLGFLEDVAETGGTFAENALLKARAVHAALGLPAVADDSGLCVDALGGAPGVFSARYAAMAGREQGDGANTAFLLENLKDKTNRQARFVCAVAFVLDTRTFCVEGSVEGEILSSPQGSSGFGYDPVFYYPPLKKSFAELSSEEKNSISHRYQALHKLAERLL